MAISLIVKSDLIPAALLNKAPVRFPGFRHSYYVADICTVIQLKGFRTNNTLSLVRLKCRFN